MSRGEMFQEYEERRKKDGFFPQLYKAVCNAMGNENIDKLVRTGIFTNCGDIFITEIYCRRQCEKTCRR